MSLWDLELERGLLAYTMRRPMTAKRVSTLRPTDFTDPAHADVFRAIVDVHNEGGRPDVEAVRIKLRQGGRSAAASKLPSLLKCAQNIHGVTEAIAVLRDYGQRRSLREPAMEIAAAAEAGDMETAISLAKQLSESLAVGADEGGWPWIITSAEAAAHSIEAMEARKERPKVDLGPFRPLAQHLLPGNLVTIGGETGAGKSSLALMVSRRWWACTKARAGIVSVEDRAHVWGGRALAHECSVNPTARDSMTQDEWDDVARASMWLKQNEPYRFAILERNDVWDVERHMRRLVTAEGCSVLIVDYLTEITDLSASRGAPRREVMSNIARRIKQVAKQLHVPVILCAQLSRPSDKKHREPTIFDLKETGDLENMSEGIVLAWKTGDSEDDRAFAKIAKLKDSEKRPRVQLIRGSGGELRSLEPVDLAPMGNGKSERLRQIGGYGQ
ncbi:MAG: DnaB-like helicase C-terminal domain-containing protein [Myxococcota bacterium]